MPCCTLTGGWSASALSPAGYKIFANNALLIAADTDLGVMLS